MISSFRTLLLRTGQPLTKRRSFWHSTVEMEPAIATIVGASTGAVAAIAGSFLSHSPLLVGYARVSTLDQNLDLQIDALQAAGCERTFTDRTSGACADRPGLQDALAFAREGDVLAVWKCDRLSRCLAHLIETVQELERRGIGFRSLAEGIDTGSAGGKIVFPIFAAIASVERTLI